MKLIEKVYDKNKEKAVVSLKLSALKTLTYAADALFLCSVGFNKSRLKEFHPHKNPFAKKLKGIRRKEVFNTYNAIDTTEAGVAKIKDIKLAWDEQIDPRQKMIVAVYEDILCIYSEYNDNYDKSIVDVTDTHTVEGSYCYVDKDNDIDITIKPGMNVIDAGAWVGDFSAYAAVKGATSYAFEPDVKTFEYLQRTASYNKGIVPVQMGLDSETKEIGFTVDPKAGGKFQDNEQKVDFTIKVTSIDDFVKDRNIDKIDFIKADIEGIERNMLRGATQVLKKHEPILSICTYHLKDDPQVIKDIILSANPNYKILQRRMKLFAWVPKAAK